MGKKQKVLFLCTGNSCRSQMAEGLLKKLDTSGTFKALSAGLAPEEEVNPHAIEVMAEIGIDISTKEPKSVDEFLGKVHISHLITVCSNAEKSCPRIWPGLLNENRHHWPIDNPAEATGTEEEILDVFRKTRDLIQVKISNWLASH